MKIKLLGTRGSYPTSNQENTIYGGNTACVEISYENTCLILDAGTGIVKLNSSERMNNVRFDILLTHLHMDHVQGLGFFRPLFDPDKEVHIWGPISSNESLKKRLSRLMSPPLFPVSLRDLACRLEFHELANSSFQIDRLKIECCYICHPGPTIGYKFIAGENSFAYIPDHELALGRNGMINDPKWISGIELARDVDLLVHDAQYTADEYSKKIGWGHSSLEQAARFASLANVKRLLLFHHDPLHSDDKLREIFSDFQNNHSYDLQIELAVEDQEYELV